MIHSISGNTAVTVAAARLLKTRGTTVLATVGDASSTMAALADASIVLDIPRYPPDAKVPGTVTVTVPLAAAVVVALCSAGMDWVTAARMLQDDINVAFDDAQHAISRLQPVTAPAAVHIVVPETPTAAAEYAQAKTAETIGVGATISGSETWLHVFKHAVTPATLVIGLADSEASASPLYWVSQETALRGGQFVANLPISWSSGRGLAFDSAGDRLPGRRNVFTQLFFVQRLCLELLRVSDWTPFQLHRVDRRQLAGISERSYTFGPARAGSREPA
jgi:fructoselysine-6-P-deglycase FrlB-like protein